MVVSTIKRLYNAFFPSTSLTVQSTETASRPLKFGILGAAAIAPPALIIPAKTHPEVVVYAVAARDVKRAEVYAQKHGIEKFYGGAEGYQKLLDDPEVEVVYNPLPNGLHYEWTMKALAAGKHVLLEKPAADTAEETRQMFELAEKKNLVLMEAFHYRFHPAIQRVKAIIDSGELGRLKSIENKLTTPAGFIKKDDIRFNLSLGGGSLMDMGCYTLNCLRYLSGTNPTQVLTAVASPSTSDSKVDRSMTATFDLPNDVFGSITCDLGVPWRFGLIPALPQVSSTVECEGGQVHIMNFVLPTLYHTIKVTKKKSGNDGKTETETRIEQVYNFADGKMEGKGEDWWLTYRYQLEAFVDKIKGRTPQTWVSKEDSVANMEWIERVYAKSGLGARPKSTFTLN
ncbi:NAD(P)-binding protein [Dendrothele bispora CBS 962.96]|uniref:D-xylose 1-dehydrogenase (NADP(+), D-xylono-1,5-lactone-forming) n=1 Tax=Dendrothele bispora (strain CBS 962.96) TaxID=1314807 RepID=A0A4S8KY92_DENBC|nr:NAD(P)-binding protein [Dendrothele bispora CBS 962.96]